MLHPGQRADQPSQLPKPRAADRLQTVRGAAGHPFVRGTFLGDLQFSNVYHGSILGRWQLFVLVSWLTPSDVGQRRHPPVGFSRDLAGMFRQPQVTTTGRGIRNYMTTAQREVEIASKLIRLDTKRRSTQCVRRFPPVGLQVG